jgi:hypothetical protein
VPAGRELALTGPTPGGGTPRRCPRCRLGDAVTAVPHIYHAGVAVTTTTIEHLGYGGFDTRYGYSRTMTPLAGMLVPPIPDRRGWLRPALVGAGLLGLDWLLITAISRTGTTIDAGILFWLALITIAGLGGVAVAVNRWMRAPVHANTHRTATVLWRASWYCRRCNVVTIPNPDGRTGRVIPPQRFGQNLTALADRFRQL